MKDDMTEQVTAVLAKMVEIEQRRDALVAEIRALAAMLPEDCSASNIEEAAKDLERVSLGGVRYQMTEVVRPKGPMVTITWKSGASHGSYERELAEITSGAFVMRTGDRYSRMTGKKIGPTDRHGPSYSITAEERARVLALGWKPVKS